MNESITTIVEAALMAAGEPLSIAQLSKLFAEHERPEKEEIQKALIELSAAYSERGIELKELASGYCFQVKATLAPWIQRLWDEKPPRYSRALLETLAIIAYRQPVTRAEIEDIRGVAVSTNIIKTLIEREWIKEVGQREVPGKPMLYGTTKAFLDHFNLKGLTDLPSLAELRDPEIVAAEVGIQLELQPESPQQSDSEPEAADALPQASDFNEDIDNTMTADNDTDDTSDLEDTAVTPEKHTAVTLNEEQADEIVN
ncbi:MAG: SMC-Scp complex subunit ScpB [Gammaproteobacteria bacterium]